jgi:carbon starvation protein CstA
MITFVIAVLALVLGYSVYGKFVERFFGASDEKATPAVVRPDGVDFLVMPTWKVFAIEFLNIAGLGPIFGAVLGALYGPMAYVWIVVGCIFMGATHDYFAGMLSVRHNGATIAEIVGQYLGPYALVALRVFTLVLLVFVGVAFVSGPAGLLSALVGNVELPHWLSDMLGPMVVLFDNGAITLWLYVIFAYYLLATLLPINKIIGKIYPVFGAFLLFMAVGIAGAMVWNGLNGSLELRELSLVDFKNYHHQPLHNLLFPMMFVVVSCGAISGFHATQAPMMARCLKKESHGRKVFYGAMIAEGIVTLIWATAAMNFFGGPNGLNHAVAVDGHNPAYIVNLISQTWLGKIGAVLAIVGVIVCPITTGDTAFRSARLTIADMFKVGQATIWKRLGISIPLFAVGFVLSKLQFVTIWKYLGLSNQVLSVIVLWTAAVYLRHVNKPHWMMSIPAVFMTSVCTSYLLIAPNKAGGLGIVGPWGYLGGTVVAFFVFFLFLNKRRN